MDHARSFLEQTRKRSHASTSMTQNTGPRSQTEKWQMECDVGTGGYTVL